MHGNRASHMQASERASEQVHFFFLFAQPHRLKIIQMTSVIASRKGDRSSFVGATFFVAVE